MESTSQIMAWADFCFGTLNSKSYTYSDGEKYMLCKQRVPLKLFRRVELGNAASFNYFPSLKRSSSCLKQTTPLDLSGSTSVIGSLAAQRTA